MLDLACSLGLIASAFVMAAAYAGRMSRSGPAHHARVERAGSSPLLGKGIMEMGYWAMRPAARFCVWLGVGPNTVSWASLVLAAGAGGALAVGHFGVAAVLSVASSIGDALDGMIARETGVASDAGEVLDAAVDRYAELFFLGGVAYYERMHGGMLLLALAATAGAIMVSYASAKAEALRVQAPRGALRRQERAVYLVLGIALVPIAAAASTRWGLPSWVEETPLFLSLALVAVVGNASAVRRLRAVAEAVHAPRTRAHERPEHEAAMPTDTRAAAGDACR